MKAKTDAKITDSCSLQSPLPCAKITLGSVRSLLFANVVNGLVSCDLLVSMRLFVSAHVATCSKTSLVYANVTCNDLCS